MVYEFSDLTLDLDRHLLTRGGQPIKLTKLSFKVLQALVQAAPALISHDDNSIAVLPFDNRSSREEDQFFTDGMHDDLLAESRDKWLCIQFVGQ